MITQNKIPKARRHVHASSGLLSENVTPDFTVMDRKSFSTSAILASDTSKHASPPRPARFAAFRASFAAASRFFSRFVSRSNIWFTLWSFANEKCQGLSGHVYYVITLDNRKTGRL